jgi:y4mF family transcriptional regulator
MVTIDTMRTLGTLARQTRVSQHLTQEQLAAACGVGIRFIRELEAGKESCHIGKVIHVTRMLGIEIQAIAPSKVTSS